MEREYFVEEAEEPLGSFQYEDGEPRLASSVIVADQRGLIYSVNDSACRLFGYPKEEMLGKSINMLMPKAIAEQHDAVLQRFYQTKTFKSSTRTVFAVTKKGRLVKISLALSSMECDGQLLVSALMDELEEHSFSLMTNAEGTIFSVEGNPEETCGYTRDMLVGLNVSMLCPLAIANAHPRYMASYVPGQSSKVIGHVRNRELRHAAGHVVPISLDVQEATREPLTFRAKITEVDQTMEAMVTVNRLQFIISASPSCAVMFGYEDDELIGMPVRKLVVNMVLKEGKQFLTCMHKDGSHFFISVNVEPITINGEDCFRGMIKRARPTRVGRQRSAITYAENFSKDLEVLGWYEITEKILGRGFFGNVKMGRHRLTGVPVAIKSLKRQQYLDVGMQYPPREIDIMKRLRHPNIFRFFHAIDTEEAVYMVSEVVTGGELFDYAAQHERLTETESRNIMRQIVSAVDYMHRSGVVHRDLKLENILLDANGNIKIIDFGLGNFFDSNSTLRTWCGSTDYASPELWSRRPYHGPEIDIWALGVILYILVTGFIPFNTSAHIIEISYHWPHNLDVTAQLKDFIARIFRPIDLRCSMEDIIIHPWLNDGGNMAPIKRRPLQGEEPVILNEQVLTHMDALGLPRKDVEQALLRGEHDQLCTTYALLEYQLENRRTSGTGSRRGSEAGLMMTPRSFESLSNSTTDEGSTSQAGSPKRGSMRWNRDKCVLQ